MKKGREVIRDLGKPEAPQTVGQGLAGVVRAAISFREAQSELSQSREQLKEIPVEPQEATRISIRPTDPDVTLYAELQYEYGSEGLTHLRHPVTSDMPFIRADVRLDPDARTNGEESLVLQGPVFSGENTDAARWRLEVPPHLLDCLEITQTLGDRIVAQSIGGQTMRWSGVANPEAA